MDQRERKQPFFVWARAYCSSYDSDGYTRTQQGRGFITTSKARKRTREAEQMFLKFAFKFSGTFSNILLQHDVNFGQKFFA